MGLLAISRGRRIRILFVRTCILVLIWKRVI